MNSRNQYRCHHRSLLNNLSFTALATVLFTRAVLALTLIAASAVHSADSTEKNMALIKAGSYIPLFNPSEGESKDINVAAFYLDTTPVTVKNYLRFVKKNPAWSKSRVKSLFTDQHYLKNWDSDFQPTATLLMDSPVTYVSWFAAKSYCQWLGKTLPTVDQWEYSASASEHNANGKKDKSFTQTILQWYGLPTPDQLPSVGKQFKNYWGVYDQHGLIWEWTKDFNNALVSGESRADSALERQLFCGSGSANAVDKSDYAAFMRYGFRSSLQARYTVANLGFRCAKNISKMQSEDK